MSFKIHLSYKKEEQQPAKPKRRLREILWKCHKKTEIHSEESVEPEQEAHNSTEKIAHNIRVIHLSKTKGSFTSLQDKTAASPQLVDIFYMVVAGLFYKTKNLFHTQSHDNMVNLYQAHSCKGFLSV